MPQQRFVVTLDLAIALRAQLLLIEPPCVRARSPCSWAWSLGRAMSRGCDHELNRRGLLRFAVLSKIFSGSWFASIATQARSIGRGDNMPVESASLAPAPVRCPFAEGASWAKRCP